jgi:hypothetical protein
MSHPLLKEGIRVIPKLVALWIALLALPYTERSLLHAKTYYGLFIGLCLVFVMYGLTVRAVFVFLRRIHPEPFNVWLAFALRSIFLCSILAVFAFAYDLLPLEPGLSESRSPIDYLYYEVITFTTVGYGDIVPR